MKPIVFHPAAEVEVESAAAFYEERRQGLGVVLRSELEHCLQIISRNPASLPRSEETAFACACCAVFLTPFFEELDGRVNILAFAHGHRRPGYWLDRATE